MSRLRIYGPNGRDQTHIPGGDPHIGRGRQQLAEVGERAGVVNFGPGIQVSLDHGGSKGDFLGEGVAASVEELVQGEGGGEGREVGGFGKGDGGG